MTLRSLASMLLCASLAVFPIAAAAADETQVTNSSRASAPPAKQFTFRVCNKTDNDVLIGSSYMPIGANTWRNKGWTRVAANDCGDMFTTTNTKWYARAEVKGDSSQYWGSDIKQCVEYPGPYDFTTGSDDTSCPEGEPAEFTTFESDGRPVYIWNLTP